MIKITKMAIKRTIRSKAGFSLVELLVAATIVLVSTYGIIFLIKSADRQSVNNNHRELARRSLINLFESDRWNEANYNMLMTNDTTVVNVVIDDRETPSNASDDLLGTMSFRNVFIDSTSSSNISLNKLPYIVIKGSVKWQELEGDYDSISIEKIICKIN